ncbi:MAG: export transporter ATP-binding protein [Gammaproteobacteria bacterium]|nr:export transporter ATP-binding protein [Gammaproteobacteria bacterium]
MISHTKSDEVAYAIDVHDLNKSFSKKKIISNLSLRVKRGQVFGLLGPNGSGKTTTMRLLCGLLKPDSGGGTCLGYDIEKESLQIKQHIGYMPQNFSLYDDLTVAENLYFVARLYGLDNQKQIVQQTILDTGLENVAHKLAGELSGGWKKRFSLAAVLMHKPKLLLLDEPTAGVDPKARRNYWHILHQLAQKEAVTIIVSTHYMDEAERCYEMAYIKNGDVLVQGTIPQIIADSKLITFNLSPCDSDELETQLSRLRIVKQVARFGNDLHVSGFDEQALKHEIGSLVSSHQRWEKIPTSLEDVFISLSNRQGSGHA